MTKSHKMTFAALAAIAVATLSLAVVPALTSTAMADKGGINHREEVCTHKGTGEEIPCEDVRGKNSDVETTCKVRGVETTPCPT